MASTQLLQQRAREARKAAKQQARVDALNRPNTATWVDESYGLLLARQLFKQVAETTANDDQLVAPVSLAATRMRPGFITSWDDGKYIVCASLVSTADNEMYLRDDDGSYCYNGGTEDVHTIQRGLAITRFNKLTGAPMVIATVRSSGGMDVVAYCSVVGLLSLHAAGRLFERLRTNSFSTVRLALAPLMRYLHTAVKSDLKMVDNSRFQCGEFGEVVLREGAHGVYTVATFIAAKS